jgi:VWFA-related protein
MLIVLVVATAIPAAASRRVSVAQLQELLASDLAAHRADLEVARRVGELEMTERLTDTQLNRFAMTLKLEPRTALALQLLADQSAFLDPPAGELPAAAAPDAATQQSMLDAARAYAVQAWTRMPNFFVTRVTNRFDDSPQVVHAGEWPVRMGLHPLGVSSHGVAFRDGKEVADETAEGKDKATSEQGLSSWGEFGPAVTVVLTDTARQKIVFSHWEQSTNGLAAVFRYDVPRESSHYAVAYCCVRDASDWMQKSNGRHGVADAVNMPQVGEQHPFHETPGYHGTISIDPATGAVMRLTIEASLSNGDPLVGAATMIEYGPITLGARTFICPVRSLAVSVDQFGPEKASSHNGIEDNAQWGNPIAKGAPGQELLINETHFTGYHRLGTSMRILADGAEPGAPNGNDAPGQSPAASAPTAAATNPAPAQAAPAEPAQVAAAAPQPDAAPAAPPPPAEPAIPEISMTPANGVPDRDVPDAQQGDGGYSLKVTSRLVDVGLVAYDKKGHPITDLNPSEIEVYDNGRKQEIHSFVLAGGAGASAQEAPSAAATPEAAPAFSNRAVDASPAAPSADSATEGSTVLVIDESHIAWADMSYARGQILKFLGSLKPGERVGLYVMNGLGFHVLTEITTDHAALIARMQKFMPSAQSVAEAQDEEMRNRQHFDEVHNVADLNSVNGNHIDVADAEQPVDPQLMTMGDDPTRSAFIVLMQVARHLSAIAGPKKLAWVSSDNVFADWRDQAVGIEKAPNPIDRVAIRAQEAMNEAHVAVYPFDVSQLEGGAISADLQHQNVQLTQAASDNASLGGGAASSRSTGPGRIDAEMSQDLHPVQGPVREVAAGTGGRVIRRAGDLAQQLDGIVDDGHATYMLSFTPQGPADGQYHTISVKLTGRKGLTLRYRTGYLFDKEPSSLRERFQQAVWRPLDVSEIAVTADVDAGRGGADVKIKIAAGDLGLQEQAGRWMDKLDIFFIRRDDAGVRAQVEGQTLGLRLKSQTFQRLMPGGIPFEHFVASKPGTASLRVVVVDENSGRMGSVTIPASALAGKG